MIIWSLYSWCRSKPALINKFLIFYHIQHNIQRIFFIDNISRSPMVDVYNHLNQFHSQKGLQLKKSNRYEFLNTALLFVIADYISTVLFVPIAKNRIFET